MKFKISLNPGSVENEGHSQVADCNFQIKGVERNDL